MHEDLIFYRNRCQRYGTSGLELQRCECEKVISRVSMDVTHPQRGLSQCGRDQTPVEMFTSSGRGHPSMETRPHSRVLVNGEVGL